MRQLFDDFVLVPPGEGLHCDIVEDGFEGEEVVGLEVGEEMVAVLPRPESVEE